MLKSIFAKSIVTAAIVACCTVVMSCSLLTAPPEGNPPEPLRYSWSFTNETFGWTGGFADFSVSSDGQALDTSIYEFQVGHRTLPSELGTQKALFIQSHNRSDDVFMFFKRRLTGLQPSKRYQVQYSVRFASSAPSGSLGIGGSPAEAVYLKAGASTIEPLAVNRNGFIEMNVDKGMQSAGSPSTFVLGNIGVELFGGAMFAFKTLSSETFNRDLIVETSADGSLWLFVGTDSGFEGLTQLYYDNIAVTLTPRE